MTRLTIVAIALTALTACNTIAGAGQDLSTAGSTITQETREIQSDL
ncbi:entericidin A/B family lipoprotein [Loktanella sp. SALINAS62]|nr:entericidin A/B family lipoprotein [Loktanella sp. SALINAS62]MBS1303971.1 entericidin A/B family lipoprotein [Loktanella sp. SALINAS62]